MKATDYVDYRQYLRDWIGSRNLTYAQFVQKTRGVVSVDTLKRLLAKQARSGDFRRSLNLSNERMAKLLQEMRIPKKEAAYVLLLKQVNDAPFEESGREGVYHRMMTSVLQDLKTKNTQSGMELAEGGVMDAALETIPETARSALLSKVLPLILQTLDRYRDRPGTKKAIRDLLKAQN